MLEPMVIDDREHAEQEHVDPGAGQTGHHRGLEELSGDPGVATDHGHGPVPLELAGVAQDVGGGDGEVQGQLRGQVTVGQAPDPVRAEEAGSHQAAVTAC